MHSLNYRAKAAGAALALGLVASACGSGATSQTTAAEPDSDVTESSEASNQEESTADVEGPVADESEDAASAEEETAAPANHLFPDLNTVNIVDGSTLNLADELAGGDTPILLWFWAPH